MNSNAIQAGNIDGFYERARREIVGEVFQQGCRGHAVKSKQGALQLVYFSVVIHRRPPPDPVKDFRPCSVEPSYSP
jgi:hypothetical protein